MTFVELSHVEVNHLGVKLNICNTEETSVIVANNSVLNVSEFRILGGEHFQIRIFFLDCTQIGKVQQSKVSRCVLNMLLF